jgi:hypothetical protein
MDAGDQIEPPRRRPGCDRRAYQLHGQVCAGYRIEVVDQVHADQRYLVGEPVAVQLSRRLQQCPAGAAAQVQPGAVLALGGPSTDPPQRIEPKLPRIAVHPDQLPLPVHGTVGHHRRPCEVIVIEQSPIHPYSLPNPPLTPGVTTRTDAAVYPMWISAV